MKRSRTISGIFVGLSVGLLLAAACTGSVSDGARPGSNSSGDPTGGGGPGNGAPGNGSNGPGSSGGPGGSGPGAAASPCDPGSVPMARTWRLTNTQFRNTVQRGVRVRRPHHRRASAGFAARRFLQSGRSPHRTAAAGVASTWSRPTRSPPACWRAARSSSSVRSPGLGSGTCLRDFLTSVGTRAWRRPLTPTELTKYTHAVHHHRAGATDPRSAFKGVVQALLLSPNFLFRTELGAGPAGSSGTITPDRPRAGLGAVVHAAGWAARRDADGSGRGAASCATRRLSRRRPSGCWPAPGRRPWAAFFRQWLQFDSLPEVAKDTAHFPSYTPELVADLMGESQALLEHVLFDPAGDQSVKTLLTASYSYLNSRTAALYGVQVDGTALVKTELPATQRRGLLTRAGVHRRGLRFRRHQPAGARPHRARAGRCARSVAPPPAAFEFDETKVTPDMTNREKFITHTTNPACASCHALFDGIGFAMEQYDAIGRFRTTDKMKTIDATGELPLPSRTLKFSSYVELIDQVATDARDLPVRGQPVRRLRHRARARPPSRPARATPSPRPSPAAATGWTRWWRPSSPHPTSPCGGTERASPCHPSHSTTRTTSLADRCSGGWALAA